MTALSNLFAWIWLLFPGAPTSDAQQIQPCAAPTEQVCAQQEPSKKKEGLFRSFWKHGSRDGISNGI